MALKVFKDYERKYYLGKQFVPWLKPRNDKKENEVERLPPHLTKSHKSRVPTKCRKRIRIIRLNYIIKEFFIKSSFFI